jgi:hypothetical protein
MVGADLASKPIRVGVLIDPPLAQHIVDDVVLATFELVADEFAASGAVTRPVDFVVRHVRGS